MNKLFIRIFGIRDLLTSKTSSVALFVKTQIGTAIRMSMRTVCFAFIMNQCVMYFQMFFWFSWFQMFRIHTIAIMANMMKPSINRNFAIKMFITKTMCETSSGPAFFCDIKKTITLRRFSFCPYPATRRIYSDSFKKSVYQRLSFRSTFTHNKYITINGA